MVPELNSGLAQRVSRPRFPSPTSTPLRTLGPELYDTQQPPALDLTRRLRLSRTSTRLAPRTAPPPGAGGGRDSIAPRGAQTHVPCAAAHQARGDGDRWNERNRRTISGKRASWPPGGEPRLHDRCARRRPET